MCHLFKKKEHSLTSLFFGYGAILFCFFLSKVALALTMFHIDAAKQQAKKCTGKKVQKDSTLAGLYPKFLWCLLLVGTWSVVSWYFKVFFHFMLKISKNQTISAIYVSFFTNQKIGSLSKSWGIPGRVKFFGRTLVRAQGGSCHNCHRERLEEEAEDHLNWTWNRCFFGGGRFASELFLGRSFFQVV